MPTVLGELKRHFRDKGWALRVPRAMQELALKVNHALGTLPAKLGTCPGCCAGRLAACPRSAPLSNKRADRLRPTSLRSGG